MKGKLYGIGVGPGDSELMTVKAARIVGKADIDRKSTRLNSSHVRPSRMPSSA